MLAGYILPSKVLDLLESTVVGVGGEIQLTDALDELLKGSLIVATSEGFLSANLAVGTFDHETKQYIKSLIDKSGW